MNEEVNKSKIKKFSINAVGIKIIFIKFIFELLRADQILFKISIIF